MRESLILALGLISISFISLDLLTGPASADNKVISHGRYSSKHLQQTCGEWGGLFFTEENGSYSCTSVETGLATDCTESGNCVNVCTNRICGNNDPRAQGNKFGNLGGSANTANPGAAPGPGTGGGTAAGANPGAGANSGTGTTAAGTAAGTIVRDHRTPGGKVPASNLPPAAAPGTIAATPVAASPAGAATAGAATAPVVRDHRPGGNSATSVDTSTAARSMAVSGDSRRK
jgi:hypothetical protein